MSFYDFLSYFHFSDQTCFFYSFWTQTTFLHCHSPSVSIKSGQKYICQNQGFSAWLITNNDMLLSYNTLETFLYKTKKWFLKHPHK